MTMLIWWAIALTMAAPAAIHDVFDPAWLRWLDCPCPNGYAL